MVLLALLCRAIYNSTKFVMRAGPFGLLLSQIELSIYNRCLANEIFKLNYSSHLSFKCIATVANGTLQFHRQVCYTPLKFVFAMASHLKVGSSIVKAHFCCNQTLLLTFCLYHLSYLSDLTCAKGLSMPY